MNVDHICIAVKDIQEGVGYWQDVFRYVQMTEFVVNTKQKVKVVFLKKEANVLVKLIEPLEDNLSLKKFVGRGGGFHHICFKCNQLEEQLAELKGKGLLNLVPPQPGEAFGGHDIAFLLAKNGLNIELIDTDVKVGLIEDKK